MRILQKQSKHHETCSKCFEIGLGENTIFPQDSFIETIAEKGDTDCSGFFCMDCFDIICQDFEQETGEKPYTQDEPKTSKTKTNSVKKVKSPKKASGQ